MKRLIVSLISSYSPIVTCFVISSYRFSLFRFKSSEENLSPSGYPDGKRKKVVQKLCTHSGVQKKGQGKGGDKYLGSRTRGLAVGHISEMRFFPPAGGILYRELIFGSFSGFLSLSRPVLSVREQPPSRDEIHVMPANSTDDG